MFRCHVCGDVYKEEVEVCDTCKAVLLPEEKKTKSIWQYAKVCPLSVKVFSILCDVMAWLLFAFIAYLGYTVWVGINSISNVKYWISFTFWMLFSILTIQISKRGCFKTYVWSKNTYIVCGIIAAIVLAEQIYVLVASGGNFGLIRILILNQWLFYICVTLMLLYGLFFFLYRVRIKQSYRTYYMEQTGSTKEEYEALWHDFEGNKKEKFVDYRYARGNTRLLVAAVLIVVCMGSFGLRVKKQNDVYMENLQVLTEEVARELAFENEAKDSFAYDMGRIEIEKEDVVLSPLWRKNAAFYNAYYGTDYDLDCLDEILYEYANNMTADLELYRFGTFVVGDGLVVREHNYNIDVWWDSYETMKKASAFVWDYLKYIDCNDSYHQIGDIPSDKLQELMNLFVTREGNIMAKDLMCRQLLGLIDRECTYNTDGKAVILSDAHINRPYLYVLIAYSGKYITYNDYIFDDYGEDYGVEEMCNEYASFCEDGILKEDGLLADIYQGYNMYDREISMAIYLRTTEDMEEVYAFVGDYVDANGGSIADMEQAESLSKEDYALLAEAYEAYKNR